MQHPVRVRRAVALAAVLAGLMLAACGSSSHSTTSTSASVSAAKTPSGPAGAPIRIGSICDCTGVQAGEIGNASKAVKAWADSVNASGGLNGHPVKLTVLDAAQNPATALQDAKQLVQVDHVIAIVGEFTLSDSAFASYVKQKGIPVVGGVSAEAPFLTNPDFYPSGAQLLTVTDGTMALAKQAGVKKLGVLYCAESPICAQLIPLAQGTGKLNGVSITAQKVSSTAPSYAAPCLSLKATGADGMFAAVASAVVLRITDACAQQGYKPVTVNQAGTTESAWQSDTNLNGAMIANYDANAFDASMPAVAQFRSAVDKYFPGYTSSSSFYAGDILPWAGGELFEAAAKAADIGPNSTPADVKKGLYALKNETLGGLSGPLNFTPGKPAFTPCYYAVKLEKGTFVSLNDDHPYCLSGAQSAALAKAVG